MRDIMGFDKFGARLKCETCKMDLPTVEDCCCGDPGQDERIMFLTEEAKDKARMIRDLGERVVRVEGDNLDLIRGLDEATKMLLNPLESKAVEETATIKTTNETLNGTVAMLNAELSKYGCSRIPCSAGKQCGRCHALNATDSTVKEWMAKRDEEKDEKIGHMALKSALYKEAKEKLEATLAEKEKELAEQRHLVETHRNRVQEWDRLSQSRFKTSNPKDCFEAISILKDRLESSEVISQTQGELRVEAEEALAKRDKEAMMLRDDVESVYSSMVATEYCMDMIRADLEKIEGPCWTVIFEAWELDREKLNDVLSSAALTKEADVLKSKEKTK